MDHTILVLYSGHGDEYFDRGFLDHGTTLYEETIHVPLFVAVPGMQEGRVVESQIRTVDLFPTVFDLLGLSSPPVTGVSVLPALNGRRRDLVGVSETEYRLFTHKSALVTADHRYKLIYTHDSRQTELYDLVKDPQERKNLVTDHPQLAKQLQDQLMALLALSSAHHPQGGVPQEN
jgi:arylsulfatase A-like enzyme